MAAAPLEPVPAVETAATGEVVFSAFPGCYPTLPVSGQTMRHVKSSAVLVCTSLLMLHTRCEREHGRPLMVGRDGKNFLEMQALARAFSPQRGHHGGALVVAVSDELTTFCPAYARTALDRDVHALLYEGLVRIDGASGEPAPALAERWDVSPDRLQWTFHLRPGIAWSDGVPLSAGDVVFTYRQVVMNQHVSSSWPRRLLTAAGNEIDISAPDSATVRFTLKHPNSAFLGLMSYPILPAHRCAPDGAVRKLAITLAPSAAPDSVVGTGPFRLARYVPFRRIVLVRNSHYWRRGPSGDSLPYLDSLVYEIVPDENTRLVRFERGESDYYEAHGRDYVQLVERRKQGNYDVHCLGPSGRAAVVAFNINPGTDSLTSTPYVASSKRRWFADPPFRQAMAHAINVDHLMATLVDSAGFRHAYPVRPSDTSLSLYERRAPAYDTALACRLLKQGGYWDADGDGVLEDSEGAAVRFTLLTNSGNKLRVAMAEQIREDLADVGIALTVQHVSYDSLYQTLTSPPYAWETALVGLDLPYESQYGREVWMSSGPQHLWHPRQSEPATAWERRIDSLFDAALVETDAVRRYALYHEWQRLTADSAPLLFTFLPEQILCISRRFGNVNPSIYGGLLHNVDELFVRSPDADDRPESSAGSDSPADKRGSTSGSPGAGEQ